MLDVALQANSGCHCLRHLEIIIVSYVLDIIALASTGLQLTMLHPLRPSRHMALPACMGHTIQLAVTTYRLKCKHSSNPFQRDSSA
jgi:hypothetical protein